MYHGKQTRDVPLRKDIRRYLRSRERMDIILDLGYTPESIKSKVPASDLQFLSVFDIHLTKYFTYKTKDLSLKSVTELERPPIPENGKLGGVESQRNPKIVAVKQATDSYNYDQLDSYRKSLFLRLNDSVSEKKPSAQHALKVNSW